MGNGLLAFAAGLGSGYLNAQQRNKDQERLDRLDAQAAELHNAKMDEYNRANRERIGLGEVGAIKTVAPAPVLSLADGTNTVYTDPGVANSDFRQLRAADQATGNQTLARAPLDVPPLPPGLADGQQANNPSAYTPPVDAPSLADGTMPQAPTTAPAINGKAYMGPTGLADATNAAAKMNTPAALTESKAAYLDSIGQPERAASLRANAKQAQLADYQLSTAQIKYVNDVANQKVDEIIKANGGNPFKAQAQIISDTKLAGLDGTKGEARTSADNKMVQIVKIGPDGKEIIDREYTNDDSGRLKATRDMYNVDLGTKIGVMQEQETARQKQANFVRTQTETERNHKAIEANKEELASARIATAQALASGGALNRENRLRYDNLFSDAGRRMAETQKTLVTLSKVLAEQTAMNSNAPDTPEIIATRHQLAGLQNDYNSYKEERATYQALLAGSQGDTNPGLVSGKKPTATAATLPRPTNKAEYDKIPKGASYIYTDGSTRVKS